MPDVYSDIAGLDEATQERLAAVLETRGADPGQQAMRQAFLADIPFPDSARVLEVGAALGSSPGGWQGGPVCPPSVASSRRHRLSRRHESSRPAWIT